ncbi:DNA double-strand break repair RAD50 ATPase [Wolffia australiana]
MGGSRGGEGKPSPATIRSSSPSCRHQMLSPPPPSQQWGPPSPLATASAASQFHEFPQRSVPSAMAKATEHRSLQASPFSFRPSNLISESEYPVFAPTYEAVPSPAACHIRSKSQPFLDRFARTDDDVFYGWRGRELSSLLKEDEPLPAVQTAVGTNRTWRPAEIDGADQFQPPPPPSLPVPQNQRGVMAWLFPRFKRKSKPEKHPAKTQYEEKPRRSNNRGDASLSDGPELKSSLVELQQKLRHLEVYSEELKKALDVATQGDPHNPRMSRMTRTRSPAPVNHEVMVEGFLQIVLEARLSVKQFCISLTNQMDEAGTDLRYHLQALVNKSLYEDFENCVFERNGSPRHLDPRIERAENFSAFVSLRELSWREVFEGGGSRPQLADLARFSENKMRSLAGLLERPGSRREDNREAFYVAAKCVWLLHLLAFSFSPPLAILRVEERRRFDSMFMEDVASDRRRPRRPGRVHLMVAPGFYVHDSVVRCKVVCSQGSAV